MSLLELNSWSGEDHAPRVLAKFWKIVLIGQRNIALEVSINKSNKSALFWNLDILMHVMGWHAIQEQIICLSSSGNIKQTHFDVLGWFYIRDKTFFSSLWTPILIFKAACRGFNNIHCYLILKLRVSFFNLISHQGTLVFGWIMMKWMLGSELITSRRSLGYIKSL